MHIAQYTQIYKNDRSRTRVVTSDILAGKANLNEFHDQIKEEIDAGRPVVLAMMPGGNQGHAILGYAMEDDSEISEIKIYDNNWPMEERTLTLTKDSAGNYISWAYNMDGPEKEVYGVWGTDQPGSNISFVHYETIMEIWNTRGKLAESSNTNMISVNSDNFSIYTASGEELARVEDGALLSSDNAIDMMEKELVIREEEDVDNVLLAPVAEYRVVNNDPSVEELEIIVANKDLGGSVNTTADEVIVSVQDSLNLNSITVCAKPEDTYSVTLRSTQNDGYNEVVASGEGSEEDVSITMTGGVLDIEDDGLNSLTVDGENYGPFTIKPSATAGGKISPDESCKVIKGEGQAYTITPDGGYVISDVIVDGKSVGAVSKYEFKNVVKDHTIVAIFETPYLYGDADGDGEVDASDLTRLARHLAKIEPIKDIELFGNSDVNHDGKVSSEDLTKLARYIAKIISSLD